MSPNLKPVKPPKRQHVAQGTSVPPAEPLESIAFQASTSPNHSPPASTITLDTNSSSRDSPSLSSYISRPKVPTTKLSTSPAPPPSRPKRTATQKPLSYDVDSSPENEYEAPGFSVDEHGSEVVEEDKDLVFIQPLLSKAGLRIIRPSCFRSTPTPMLLVCTASNCEKGINVAAAIHHATSKSQGSHGLKLHHETVVQPIMQWLESNTQRILSHDNARSAPIPHRNSAPLWGLKVMDGLACKECTRCFPAKNSMDKHWSQDHHGLLHTVEPRKRLRDAKLQTYFLSSANYFEINPNLARLCDNDIFSLYLTQHAEKMDKECSNSRPSPQSEKDIPPLLKVFTLAWTPPPIFDK